MNLKWIQESSYIFGYSNDNLLVSSKIKNVYMFDLDYTLIKTKSGKKFPIDKNDWKLLHHNVKIKLDNLSDCLIGIITNQKGLKNDEQKKDWKDKINQIVKILKIDFIFTSTSDDRYRKPLPGSYEYIKNYYNSIDWNELNTSNNIYYIGDAFGREKDFSDTDIKYAINNDFKFKTPEIFFGFNKDEGKSGFITYPEINYFTCQEQKKIFDKLDKLVQTHKKIFIITIGFPASGKSFLRKELIKKYPQFSYSNNDDIINNVQSKMLIKELSTDYNFIIDDNTNLNKYTLNEKLKLFNDYYKIGIWFNYELDVCFHLNWLRMYWFGAKLLPKLIYYTLKKKFDLIDPEKEFDKFIQIDKIFKEFDLDNKIKYYF